MTVLSIHVMGYLQSIESQCFQKQYFQGHRKVEIATILHKRRQRAFCGYLYFGSWRRQKHQRRQAVVSQEAGGLGGNNVSKVKGGERFNNQGQ